MEQNKTAEQIAVDSYIEKYRAMREQRKDEPKSADEIRQEAMMDEIIRRTPIVFKEVPEDEVEKKLAEIDKKWEALEKKKEAVVRKKARRKGFVSAVKSIICTPLSIAFHAISFVSKGIGYISSFGLLIGFYYLYQSFSALFKGVAFAEIETFGKAVPFLVFPFIAYGVSVVTEKVWLYLEAQSA